MALWLHSWLGIFPHSTRHNNIHANVTWLTKPTSAVLFNNMHELYERRSAAFSGTPLTSENDWHPRSI